MNLSPLRVAAPWSLTHYLPLNGFHPLYRALFESTPQNVVINSWDNVRVHRRVARDLMTRSAVMQKVFEADRAAARIRQGSVARAYQDYFWPPNQALTELLPGDIEFHHTAPYPSGKRPFVFHCESFAPVFLPFAHQGGGEFENHALLREHYRDIFANPACLGIFSHVPETLTSFRAFFSDPAIDAKLYPSRIGLSRQAVVDEPFPPTGPLSRPRFLFVNSANQNPANFFLRGGHLVLRFWKEFRGAGRDGLLMLRCARPIDQELLDHGVDAGFVAGETGRSIVWACDYLANHEMNALMASAHFFLLPSASLHSVSILQAMMLGAVPVVTDTVGTDVYVADRRNGIVLQGMRAAIWTTDPATGILVDRYERTPALDESLVQQMAERIGELLDSPDRYTKLRQDAVFDTDNRFAGRAFAEDFWATVTRLSGSAASLSTAEADPPSQPEPAVVGLNGCMLGHDDWSRVFESPTQPLRRAFTGESLVMELGGATFHARGNPKISLHDWSVLAQYYNADAPQITLANSIADLDGRYLSVEGQTAAPVARRMIRKMSRLLMPYPELHSFASGILNRARRFRRYLAFHLGKGRKPADIELVVQGASGFNVVRYFHKFYAVPQGEGPFSLARIAAKEYSRTFRGPSVDNVLRQIEAATGRPITLTPEATEPTTRPVQPSLAKEGFHGFNIIQYGAMFHAILQSDGKFDIGKIGTSQYSREYSGKTLDEVMQAIAPHAGRESSDVEPPDSAGPEKRN
jgi:hypothetical protein